MKIGLFTSDSVFNKNRMFDINDSKVNRDNIIYPYYLLRENLIKEKVEFNTLDFYENYEELDAIFFFKLDFQELYKILKSDFHGKLIYFAWEPPVVSRENSPKKLKGIEHFFHYIMTWNDEIIDNEKYFKINIPQYFDDRVDFTRLKTIKDKKLLVSISMDKSSSHPDELYGERKKVISHFEINDFNDFDFYGMLWEKNRYKNYKGSCESKAEIYTNYRFALCFENMKNVKGYISEKIFDCFRSGIIPIYYGAENVSDYIPEHCYIDYSKFKNIHQVYDYISNIDQSTYNGILNRIIAFLESDARKVFEEGFLRKQIIRVINKDHQPLKLSGWDALSLSGYCHMKSLKAIWRRTKAN